MSWNNRILETALHKRQIPVLTHQRSFKVIFYCWHTRLWFDSIQRHDVTWPQVWCGNVSNLLNGFKSPYYTRSVQQTLRKYELRAFTVGLAAIPEQLTLERLKKEFVVGLDLLHLGSLHWSHHNSGRYVRSSISGFSRGARIKTISTRAVLLWSHPKIELVVESKVWNGTLMDSAESWAQTKGEQPRLVRPLNKVTVNINKPVFSSVCFTHRMEFANTRL